MKAALTIVIIAVIVGIASGAWLMIIVMAASKKVKDEAVLKRWLRMRGLLLIAVVLMAGCSPGKMVGTGYLVSVKQDGHTEIQKVATRHQADSIYHATVGTDPLGNDDPFFEFRNSELFIYIEKKGIYERNGKRRWKVYDEELDLSVPANAQSLTPDISPPNGREKIRKKIN